LLIPIVESTYLKGNRITQENKSG